MDQLYQAAESLDLCGCVLESTRVDFRQYRTQAEGRHWMPVHGMVFAVSKEQGVLAGRNGAPAIVTVFATGFGTNPRRWHVVAT
jgi:hypothetical protein